MATNSGENLRIHGLVAATDLSAKQYYVVMLATTAKQVKVSAGDSKQCRYSAKRPRRRRTGVGCCRRDDQGAPGHD